MLIMGYLLYVSIPAVRFLFTGLKCKLISLSDE